MAEVKEIYPKVMGFSIWIKRIRTSIAETTEESSVLLSFVAVVCMKLKSE